MAKISRRNFIKSSLAMGVAPVILGADEKKESPKLSFIHVTDSHMDLADEDSVSAMELMVEHINTYYKELDFVLFGGDNYNNNVDDAKDAKRFKAICDGLTMPYYAVRGNKESNTKTNPLHTFRSLFLQDKSLHVNNFDWVIEKNGYKIVGLDSCITDANNGLYSKDSINFAESILKENKPTVILNHHPYTNYWKGTESKDIYKYVLGNSDEVQKKLFTYPNLMMTLSGHKHIDSVTTTKGVKTVVTRGFVRPLDLDMYPMRYVNLDGNQVFEKLIYTS